MTLMMKQMGDSGVLDDASHAANDAAQTGPALTTRAVVFEGGRELALRELALKAAGPGDLVVDVLWSGVSTGTERLLWTGDMPPFPGMGYPLVPGYEAVGRVIAAIDRPELVGRAVFVPGANCYEGAHGLFGASSRRLVTSADRVTLLDGEPAPEMALLALAATAHHAIAGGDLPDLVVGHGVLGRLTARIAMALGAPAPTVWEINPDRMDAADYPVIAPDDDPKMDYRVICDMSGSSRAIDTMIAHAARGAEIILAGFYMDRPSFAFPPAFMKEIRLRVAAEWAPADIEGVLALLASGKLSFDGLITHTCPANEAEAAYHTAFEDARCLKLILDWRSRE